MRVAVACDGKMVSAHFGRCERYMVADVDGATVNILPDLVNPGHEPGVLPRLMKDNGIECVLAGGAGPRAVSLLNDAGIQFVAGVGGEAADALKALAEGTLETGESACEH